MRNIVKAVLAILLISTASAEELREESALGGLVKIKVPQSFRVMTDAERMTKYPMRDGPKVVFTNAEGNINIAINQKPNQVPPEQIEELRQALSRGFHNMQPSATWYNDKVREISGRRFSYLELTTPALDMKIHNHMLATSADGILLMISVNMPETRANELAPMAQSVIESIRVTRP